ncbi:hypothetical protein HI914_05295 [Erysiphe necator]|nr:hypothetical protein HI914_05295 [Erysiphe necator]
MRHSAAHLAIALCTTMAVSSAPVSPNPISPALVTPLMNSENQALDVNEKAQRSPPQKRSVGGFAYHELDQSEFDKRAIASPSENGVQAESFAPSDSDDGFSSGFESDSDNDVGAASDTEIQRRSIPEIWTRSPPPSPQQEAADASGFDDNASDALADDNLSDMSDDDNFSKDVPPVCKALTTA